MNNFSFSLPTTFYFGFQALKKNGKSLSELGRRAFLVTGANGAKACGAYDDAVSVLGDSGIEWMLFDRIEQNPSVATCITGGRAAKAFNADFVMGIGGGSAIDAAKAIAVIAANGIKEDVFGPFDKMPLPVAAVPTTAGTGSEGNGISVLTSGSNKRSIKDIRCFPKLSFIDPGYLRTLPAGLMMSCALDAFCHTAESYLSVNSTPVSECLAMSGLKRLWVAINELHGGRTDDELNAELSLGAAMGGTAIQITGTGLPHPMGYNLTLFKGIHHGTATAVFLPYYLDRCMMVLPRKMSEITETLKVLPNEVGNFIKGVAVPDIEITESEAVDYMSKIAGASQFKNTPFEFSDEDIKNLYLSLFG